MHDHAHGHDHGEGPSWKLLLASAAGCGVFTLTGVFLQRSGTPPNLAYAAYAAAYLCGGWEKKPPAGMRARQTDLYNWEVAFIGPVLNVNIPGRLSLHGHLLHD